MDLLECAIHIGDLIHAERFLGAAEETFGKLAAHPFLGWARKRSDPRLSGIRTWRMEGFEKHLIFYQPLQSGVLILRVLHGSRDVPGELSVLGPMDLTE